MSNMGLFTTSINTYLSVILLVKVWLRLRYDYSSELWRLSVTSCDSMRHHLFFGGGGGVGGSFN